MAVINNDARVSIQLHWNSTEKNMMMKFRKSKDEYWLKQTDSNQSHPGKDKDVLNKEHFTT